MHDESIEATVDLSELHETVSGSRESLQDGSQNQSSNPLLLRNLSSAENRVQRRYKRVTRELLRSRLITASLLGLICLSSVKLAALVTGNVTFAEASTRVVGIVFLSAMTIALFTYKSASLRLLRIGELFVFAIPLIELIWIQVIEINQRVELKLVHEVPTMFAIVSMADCLLIAIYGMLIPAGLVRALSISGIAALAPSIVMLIHKHQVEELATLPVPGFAPPLISCLMAIVAATAAHIVQRIRRDYETAKLYGQYELVQEIGRGGMGVVYKAKHQMLKRPAAIKLIRSESAMNEKAVAGFEQEVQLSAKLSHWNTVQIYDYGRTQEGDFYYVMELLEGETLRERLDRVERLSPYDSLLIARQVCAGLQEAHLKGMTHRDIKPANLFLARLGESQDVVKILDFGLAISNQNDAERKTVSGSPPYMSPEQILGKPSGPSSDVYAMGCVLFEMLTGEKRFNAESINETLRLHLADPEPLKRLPKNLSEFEPIIERCLQREPEERFRNGGELGQAIDDLLPRFQTLPS